MGRDTIMNNQNLIKSALKKIEEVYRVHIVIKDMYSFMQTSPILRDLLCTFRIHDNPYCMYAVSYTHLDVYKRQRLHIPLPGA